MNSFHFLGTKICNYCYKILELDKLESMNLKDVLNLPQNQIDKIEAIIGKKYDLIPDRNQHCIICVEEIKKKNKK